MSTAHDIASILTAEPPASVNLGRLRISSPSDRASAPTRTAAALLAGITGAVVALFATQGSTGAGLALEVVGTTAVAMMLAGWAVTGPAADWPPGRSERALRALVAAPAVGAVMVVVGSRLGLGDLPWRSLAAGTAVMLMTLLLVGRFPGRRTATAGDWAPPMDGDGAVVLPPLCRAFKRSVDLAGAGVALFLTLPVLLIAAVAVVRDSEGPWLFRQVRVGAAGRPFTLFKLRTMTTGNDPSEHEAFVASLIKGTAPATDGAIFKLTVDRRVTRVGHILRRLSIDELPQLLNVLQGRMSLVGPRPPLPGEVAHYDMRARQRLAVKPGMTGLWQVSGRSRLPFAAMVDLDIRYWSEWTPLLELRILARTPRVALFGKETA